jgi:GR25 family glycosyltransferase involved in LPS biosynthesis
MPHRLTTLVINMDKDVDRLGRIFDALGKDEELNSVRIQAIPGSSLPQAARVALAHNEGWASKAGEIGCFLSHVKAWEFVAGTDAPFCIVLEDDAIPIGLDRLATTQFPDDFEFIFINDRMTVGSRTDPPTLPARFVAVRDSLPLLNDRPGGVGGDGYILTPGGARKLLDAVSKDLFFGHVDWRLLRYCVKPEDLEGELNESFVASVIRSHHNPQRAPAWGVLRAYCANTPLVHFGVGSSSREEINNAVSNRTAHEPDGA